MKNKTKNFEANVAQSVSRAKKNRSSKKSTLRVRRVNAATPNMASSIASQLGYNNLAQDLTSQPKAVIPDFIKTESGNTVGISKMLAELADEGHGQYELPESVTDAFQNTYGTNSENNGNATAGLAAWLITRSALQRVQQFENLVADATKEYWQAKRKLLLVNKILASAYKSLETEDVENIKLPSKEEIHDVITDTLANELFPSDSNPGRSAKSAPRSNGAKQIFKRSIPS